MLGIFFSRPPHPRLLYSLLKPLKNTVDLYCALLYVTVRTLKIEDSLRHYCRLFGRSVGARHSYAIHSCCICVFSLFTRCTLKAFDEALSDMVLTFLFLCSICENAKYKANYLLHTFCVSFLFLFITERYAIPNTSFTIWF